MLPIILNASLPVWCGCVACQKAGIAHWQHPTPDEAACVMLKLCVQ
jgi:hypothetical protein